MQALAHAGQPHARPPRPDLLADQRTPVAYCRYPPPRVLDGQHDGLAIVSFLAREPDSCGGALGVTRHVCQRLLHNTEHRQFGVGRQTVDVGGYLEVDREAAALDIAIDVTAKGRPQARLVEQWRVREV